MASGRRGESDEGIKDSNEPHDGIEEVCGFLYACVDLCVCMSAYQGRE